MFGAERVDCCATWPLTCRAGEVPLALLLLWGGEGSKGLVLYWEEKNVCASFFSVRGKEVIEKYKNRNKRKTSLEVGKRNKGRRLLKCIRIEILKKVRSLKIEKETISKR